MFLLPTTQQQSLYVEFAAARLIVHGRSSVHVAHDSSDLAVVGNCWACQ